MARTVERYRMGACLTALLALAALLSPDVLVGGEVVIVTAGKDKPYEQARDASRGRLQSAGFSCTTLRLDEVDEAQLKEIRKRGPAAFLAIGSDAASYLHQRLDGTVPLCFCMVGDPESAGLTKGTAAIGVTTEVALKTQFELVRQAMPKAGAVGLLYRSATAKGRTQLTEIKAALPAGWRLEAVAVEEHGSLSEAIDALLRKKVDLVWTRPDATLYNAPGVRALLLGALRQGVPVYGFSRPFVRAGALLGIGVEPETQGEQVAEVLQKLLREPDVARQTTVHSPRGNVIVNQIVAERLSIKLPSAVVDQAAEVIGAEQR